MASGRSRPHRSLQAHRYNINVDGVATIDPRNPLTSVSNNNVWSLALVPIGPVRHERSAARCGRDDRLLLGPAQAHRRMHVYTPPGYEAGNGRYPVFYLLHGAGDSDEAWTSVGRAGIIPDNLIAAKKAQPMIVVMPMGHTNGPLLGMGAPPAPISAPDSGTDDFTQDFNLALRPYIEKQYRVKTGRENRAIAGLSMGGSQTFNIAIPNPNDYAYVGVFSSGVLGGSGRGRGAAPALHQPAVWRGLGEASSLAMLDKRLPRRGSSCSG